MAGVFFWLLLRCISLRSHLAGLFHVFRIRTPAQCSPAPSATSSLEPLPKHRPLTVSALWGPKKQNMKFKKLNPCKKKRGSCVETLPIKEQTFVGQIWFIFFCHFESVIFPYPFFRMFPQHRSKYYMFLSFLVSANETPSLPSVSFPPIHFGWVVFWKGG